MRSNISREQKAANLGMQHNDSWTLNAISQEFSVFLFSVGAFMICSPSDCLWRCRLSSGCRNHIPVLYHMMKLIIEYGAAEKRSERMKKARLKNQAVGPFPAMLVGAVMNEKPTYTTVGAGGCASLDPVLCVSLKNTHYITEAIIETGSFSVNIPSTGLLEKLDYCGIVSGRQVDKSVLFESFFDPSGQAPMISECPLNFLCRVCDTTEVRGFTMFFGEITAAFADEDCLTGENPDPIKIDPIIMMGFRYCSLKSVIGQPFSDGKKLNRV